MPLPCRLTQVKTDHHGSIRGTGNSHEIMQASWNFPALSHRQAHTSNFD